MLDTLIDCRCRRPSGIGQAQCVHDPGSIYLPITGNATFLALNPGTLNLKPKTLSNKPDLDSAGETTNSWAGNLKTSSPALVSYAHLPL